MSHAVPHDDSVVDLLQRTTLVDVDARLSDLAVEQAALAALRRAIIARDKMQRRMQRLAPQGAAR